MITRTSSGKFHAKVEANGVIGHAIKLTPEGAFFAAAWQRYVTDKSFTSFARVVNATI